ncbi:hypothetical protein ACTMU2_39285 [Cupriavidus basilensis]
MVAVGITGGIIIAVSAHWIIHLLYGSAFASAADLLQLAALASSLVFADVALHAATHLTCVGHNS